MRGWAERARERERERKRERESRLSMRGNASVDARIKVLFDTRGMSLPCERCGSIISNNSPNK